MDRHGPGWKDAGEATTPCACGKTRLESVSRFIPFNAQFPDDTGKPVLQLRCKACGAARPNAEVKLDPRHLEARAEFGRLADVDINYHLGHVYEAVGHHSNFDRVCMAMVDVQVIGEFMAKVTGALAKFGADDRHGLVAEDNLALALIKRYLEPSHAREEVAPEARQLANIATHYLSSQLEEIQSQLKYLSENHPEE
ncbi:MAG: hypothetical protein FD180_3190 [Planctomycetota bacterium]|nr:MAG: hypothetical protein FD180_3190 [Planctomycetota bacterium]